MILEQILTHKRKEVEETKLRFPLNKIIEALERSPVRHRNFIQAISDLHKINLIGEIKKASPLVGVLREDFNALKIAALYEYATISAISILTDMHFFKGRPSYLKTVRRVTTKPLLRKDFVIESYQLYESALLEADALLLISSILTDEELKLFIKKCQKLNMTALVETHTEDDLKKALACGAKLIGINNRDLKTMQINPRTAERLIRHIPKEILVVVESGIETYEEIMRLKSLGFHAFLVGTALMQAEDIVTKIKELKGVH